MGRHSRAIPAALSAIAAIACVIGFAAYLTNKSEKTMPIDKKKELVYSQYKDDPWPKIGAIKPGEWLYIFDEEGQTLEEYKKDLWNKKDSIRHTIYLQPLGEFLEDDKKLLEKMREFAAIFFNCDAKLLPPQPMPEKTYNTSRHQYNASRILDILKREVPRDALSYSAITLQDIHVPKLNFVFGLASLTDRVGIYSLIRYRWDNDDEKILLRRAIKVMTHEVGHIFGLNHCVFYKCGMCGSNSLKESDSRPLFFCPLCLDKLKLALDFDIMERYGKLQKFFEENSLDEELTFVQERMKYLKEAD